MPTVNVTTSPASLDTGSTAVISAKNTGAQSCYLLPGDSKLRPGETRTLATFGAAVSAYCRAGSTTVDVNEASVTPAGTLRQADFEPGAATGGARMLAARQAPATNPVAVKTIRLLQRWIGWLEANSAKGFVSEIGFPGQYVNNTWAGQTVDNWAPVAEAWLQAVHNYDVGVSQWLDPTGIFAAIDNPRTDTPSFGPGAAPMLRSTIGRYVRCMQAGGAAGVAPPLGFFNGSSPTAYPQTNWFPKPGFYRLLANAGFTVCRLSFRWETLQPTLGGSLNGPELARIKGAVADAAAAGLKVILDLHNYGGYQDVAYTSAGATPQKKIGSAQCTQAHFVDVWTRLSAEFKGDSRVYAYELMNEPQAVPVSTYGTAAAAWEAHTQAVVTALRAAGDTTLLLVPGYEFSAVSQWVKNHPVGWITDTASNFRYCAHHYWSSGVSSDADYALTWADEVAAQVFPSSTGGYPRVRGSYATSLIGGANHLIPVEGVTTLDRCSATTDLAALTSGTHYFTAFIADEDRDVTTASIAIGVQAASGTAPTVARITLYEIGADKSGVLLAATVHDGALGTAADAMTTPANLQKSSVNVTVRLRKGVLYAVGVIFVGVGTMPRLKGVGTIPDRGAWPQPSFSWAGRTNVDASWTAGTTSSSGIGPFYAKLV